MTICNKDGCCSTAVCAIGIAMYPPAAVMQYHKTSLPLSRILVGLRLCDVHFHELAVAGPGAILSDAKQKQIRTLLERSTGTVVDPKATKIVRVSLDDPDLLQLGAAKGQ